MKRSGKIDTVIKKFYNNEKAFTLIELVLSIFILALIIIPTFTFFMNSIMLNKVNDIRERALYIAQQEIERLKSQEFDALEAEETSNQIPKITGYPIFTLHSTVITDSEDSNKFSYSLPGNIDKSKIKAIFAKVTWKDDNELVLKTIITK